MPNIYVNILNLLKLMLSDVIDSNLKMTDRSSKNLSKFPKYGWKVKLDHKFPETRDQNLKPKFKQIIPLIPLGIRYLKFWTQKVRLLLVFMIMIHLLIS